MVISHGFKLISHGFKLAAVLQLRLGGPDPSWTEENDLPPLIRPIGGPRLVSARRAGNGTRLTLRYSRILRYRLCTEYVRRIRKEVAS